MHCLCETFACLSFTTSCLPSSPQEMCGEAAERSRRLRQLQPLLERLQQLVTAGSCRLQLVQLAARLDRLRDQLEAAAGSALSLQLRMHTVRQNCTRLDDWARTAKRVLDDAESDPTEEHLQRREVRPAVTVEFCES